MKDNKVERVRQQVMILKQQFLQGDAGLFDQALGEQEVATVKRGQHRKECWCQVSILFA